MIDYKTAGYKALRGAFNDMSGSGDPWGEVMGWIFAVAHVLWHETDWDGGDIDYRHGDFDDEDTYASENDGETGDPDYETAEVYRMLMEDEATEDDLRLFVIVLARYSQWLEKAGRSY